MRDGWLDAECFVDYSAWVGQFSEIISTESTVCVETDSQP